MRRVCMVAAVVFVSASLALAKDPPVVPKPGEAKLAEAQALVTAHQPLKAAERLGDAAALAHGAGDLALEELVADAIRHLIDDLERIPPVAAAGTTAADARSQSGALAAILRKLDPVRSGAYVSAPLIARTILLFASESGRLGDVPAAADVAAAHGAKAPGSRAASVFARYAEGMRAVAEKRDAAATAPLESAMNDAAAAGWTDVVTHAGTELAAAWLRAGDAEKAAAATARVVALCGAGTPRHTLARWSDCVRARLVGAPAAVRKPADDAISTLMGSSTAVAAGKSSPGGDGADEGAPVPISDVGRLLKKLGKGKPFVSVTCTAKGFDIHWATAPALKALHPFAPGETRADHGGVALTFASRGVALRMLDPVGNAGLPGTDADPSDTRAFYLLAPGETWSVSKEGLVSISK